MLKLLRAASIVIPKAARLLEVPTTTGSSILFSKFAPRLITSTRSAYSQNMIINDFLKIITKGEFDDLEVISTDRYAIVNLGQGNGVIEVNHSKSFTLTVNGCSIVFKGAGKEKVTVIDKDITREPNLLDMAGVLAMGAWAYFFDRKPAVTNKVITRSADDSDKPITKESKPQLK